MTVELLLVIFFFFKQKTAYEMRISDWSSDVCSSDLPVVDGLGPAAGDQRGPRRAGRGLPAARPRQHGDHQLRARRRAGASRQQWWRRRAWPGRAAVDGSRPRNRDQRAQRGYGKAGATHVTLDPARTRHTSKSKEKR